MDISSLLSPSLDSLPTPSKEANVAASESAECSVDLSTFALKPAHSNENTTTAERTDQQVVPLHKARPKAPAAGRQTAQSKARAPTEKVRQKQQQHQRQQQQQQLTVVAKPKKKRRLSVKQLQIRHENELDESQLYNLTLDINDLKQEVQDYLVHKSVHATRALVNRQNFNAGVLGTTHHFFQVLRSGFREWEQQEAAFLGVTLDRDVAVGTIGRGSAVTGSNQFFEQWRRYSKLLQTRSVTHSSINILVSDSESCVVECKGEFEGRLTLAAIEAVFPHVLQDVELLGKVVNRKFVCPRKTLIYFDERGRIVQYEANVDFFAGLDRILASNPMDLITLMSNARISSEGSLIPDADDGTRFELVSGDANEATSHASEDEYDFAPVHPIHSPLVSSVASAASPFNSSCLSRNSVRYILS